MNFSPYKIGTSIVFLFVIIIICYNHFFYTGPAEPTLFIESLNNLQENALDKMSTMIELLISLSTAIFAVVGFFTTEKFKSIEKIGGKNLFFASCSISFAALSIDFGYIAMQKWVELLGNQMFNPFDSIVTTPLRRQFYSFFLSIIFLGLFIYNSLSNSFSSRWKF